uniref:Tetratricopeptide repeat protein 1 n=1 Tax=Corethron hystrix TaxID=216773 RepID=A0A7S1FNT7_9STRA|mmetsp:Transcript_16953/g.38148  ORF Transcript_16953/g.38148 Transcript_16953/m.38148 type:complete len:138 (+) Transcript_16953:92-505(+)
MKLSTYHCNRAACSLYLGQYEEVIDDCTISLMLNSKYTKAFLRRMAAYEQIDDIESALNDAGEALKTDPTNRVARDHVTRLKKKNDERLEKLKEETMGKLKDLGNSILGNFGLSLDNFKAEKDPNTGSYSINFEQKK